MTAAVQRPDRAGTEELLRAALDAKARTVGPDSLRRAAPPSLLTRPRTRVRPAAVAVLGLAAALACVLLVLTAARREGDPVPPASPTHSPTAPEQRRGGPAPAPAQSGTAAVPRAVSPGGASEQAGPAAVAR
ncbi:hypothetical protein [Streptomyces sp. MI02-7b]|uniref:hypothetical protein n=1 Tax=Streptomyces sp. MI02-7b TaxID=462941 RepID=UPI0029A66631|nr:hypothetical protein [Streptomyces sp. MI02-7b]MDX3073652.1 hypothetical protein [Streptomyces sp. MI02-7b]